MPAPDSSQLAGMLLDLFGPLDPDTLDAMQRQLEWLQLPAGTALFRQGEPGDALYIVVSGRLRVALAEAAGGARSVGEVGRGECVGEFALLTSEPRSASVWAVRDSTLVRLAQAQFERLVQHHPQAMARIARYIVKRLNASERGAPIGAGARTFAVLPTADNAPLAEFARQLAAALAALGPTLLLDSAQCDRLLSQPGIAQAEPDADANGALVGWLSEQESRYQAIIYTADFAWSAWTRRCLRQADRVLLLGRGGGDPAPGQAELALRAAGTQARTELVLLHPPDIAQPQQTGAWLAQRPIAAHHHLRQGAPADFARLARQITGRTIGLVLSGGGARGIAHIGALRALEEAGLQPDIIGGTSIGALVGALYTAGYSPADMARLAAATSSRRRLLDFTLPLVAFNATRKLTALYRDLFGETQIEDLWRSFFCVSSNLTRAEPVIHERGALWAAVRASTAIPVIFAPLLHSNGDVLIDGGILNNFPIDIMRARCAAGPVIGIDVAPPTDKLHNYQFGPSVSGWQQLWQRLRPGPARQRAPTLFESLVRTIEINSAYRVRSPSFRRHADLLIQMPDRPFGRLAFDIHAEMIELGYNETRRQLATWERA